MAMSANAVMMKFFKLPPAMRMVLALAGFGSLASIIFMLLPALRTREGKMWVLIIGGIGLLLFLLIWGIRRMFFKKKSSQLSDALESQGPTRGDIAEQEKIYREKFRAKLADLKTNGLNVYKLPWFVLMGEPGCGKTASLIHSGLDFPLGKDEVPGFGGTRNYNWWFTNDAVILDTAGRIAFQEEGTTDKVEWEYFLKLLKANRPRCPVNGLVIALPADKLLRDNSEERAQKATILRERLRQVHQALGVRFPTFILITKMDLAGGFSEFFEEIRVDLQQRNQMCGWSRPGEFQEPYDPAGFTDSFDMVYHRLRDWGMRYLQRKATEEELGLIVTFPESFRQLREPLNDYVSTIFQKSPLLEPPFFRGFYFTSAVQEGAPIFDVFSRSKAGISVAERPTKAADSKAFFIHDFYGNKVFPEHGLVFRSAKHVSLNKRMRRIVWLGSAAMILLMIIMFIFGLSGTRELVEAPTKTCDTAIQTIDQGSPKYSDLAANLPLAKQLDRHYQAYSRPWTALYARLLFVGADIRIPQEAVGKIHARFVLDCVLAPILAEVDNRLATTKITLETPHENRQRYLAALSVYTKWYGEVVGQYELEELTPQEIAARRVEFETLLRFLELGDVDFKDAADQFEIALKNLSTESRSFALQILRDGLGFDVGRATSTIETAVRGITASWMPYTQLSANNANPMVKYWADFANYIGDLRDRYEQILALSETFADEGQYAQAVTDFMKLTQGVEHLGDMDYGSTEPGSLHEAYYNLMNFLDGREAPQTAEHRIIRLSGLLDVFQDLWNPEYESLLGALQSGAPNKDLEPQVRIYKALSTGRSDLEVSFRNSLSQIRSRLGLGKSDEPLAYYAQRNLINFEEIVPPTPREESARITLHDTVFGRGSQLKEYLIELRTMMGGAEQELKELENLEKWPNLLHRLTSADPIGKVLNLWFAEVEKAGNLGSGARKDVITQKSQLKEYPFWRPVELFELASRMWVARQNNSTELLLTRMAEKATATLESETMPGLARLVPGFDKPSNLPFDRNRFNMAQPEPVVREQPREAEPEEEDTSGLGRLGRTRKKNTQQQPEQPPERLQRETTTALLYDYHTLKFMINAQRVGQRTQAALKDHPGSERVIQALDRAANAYLDAFYTDWFEVYSDPTKLLDEQTLAFLETAQKGEISWPVYVETLNRDGRSFAAALADRTAALIREVVMFDVELADDEIDNQVYDRIVDRLGVLNRDNRSIPYLLRPMRDERNAPDRGTRDVAYAQTLIDAWDDYLKQVRDLGVLEDDTPLSGEPPALPDLEQLGDNIVYKHATTTEFPLIKPLIDIAQYGQELLVHHLDAKLAQAFADHWGKYPLIHPELALDDTPELVKIRDLDPLDPQTFIDLLAEVRAFQKRYGGLYGNVRRQGSPAQNVLYLCNAWVKFLYEQPEMLERNQRPRAIDVWVAIVRDQSGTLGNAGRVYSKQRLTLPLLTLSGNPAQAIEGATRSGEGIRAGSVQEAIGNQPAEYRWNLFTSENVSFDRMTAIVSDRHPDASASYPDQAAGWSLPGDPWRLLMAIGSRAENDLSDGYWQIPVRMETGVEPIGFVVGLKIGSRERPFPGVIPPLEKLPPQPKMIAAEKYLGK